MLDVGVLAFRKAALVAGVLLAMWAFDAPPLLSQASLDRALLHASEAPSGSVFIDAFPHTVSLEDIAAFDEVEASELQADGFGAALQTQFATPGLLEQTPGSTNLPKELFVQTQAFLFASPDGAQKALDYFRKRAVEATFVIQAPIEGLGSSSFGYSFLGLGFPELEIPGFGVVWRRTNAVFRVTYAGTLGTIEEHDARGVARRVNERTRA